MGTMFWRTGALAIAAGLLLASTATAQKVSFKDPTGDDNGPGSYTYPTDAVYKRGSFDLTGLDVESKGGKVTFDVTMNSPLEDPWGMKTGFALQMIFIFIDTGPGGFTDTVPGLNVKFDEANAWDKLVILSPQPVGRVKDEISSKIPADRAGSVLTPSRIKGAGRTISGTVEIEGDPSQWGYQVVVQSNEGFPAGGDLLTRKVNEYEGQHRFGGGTDSDCDPHAIDILAGSGTGDASEVQAQHDMLKYECNPDGSAKTGAVLKMVKKS